MTKIKSQPVNLHTPHTDEVCVADCLITSSHSLSLSLPPAAFAFNPRSPISPSLRLHRKPLSHSALIHLEGHVETIERQEKKHKHIAMMSGSFVHLRLFPRLCLLANLRLLSLAAALLKLSPLSLPLKFTKSYKKSILN